MARRAELADFVAAQDEVYDQVQRELASGRKRTHWIWFVFPQLTGLGRSSTAEFYGLASKEAARAYFDHPVLGPRLKECVLLAFRSPAPGVAELLGSPDDLKLRSCLTLFAAAAPEEPLFAAALNKFYDGVPDPLTVERLRANPAGPNW